MHIRILLCFLALCAPAAGDDLQRGTHFNLTPPEAARAMTVPEGFAVTLFAGEPDVRQPNAFCIDDRGRLWVGENYTYTKTGWTPDQRDKILIFEDADGDGRFDQRKVFTDDITYISGIEVGFGGVWVGSPPSLLFIPDRDQDDTPDGKPVVVLDGWGREDQHETLNSFAWGPDGWLYGCHGVFTHSKVGQPGAAADQRTPLDAAVWRYHPLRREFEVFAHGTSNPWGLDWDEHGQMFMTACVIPHLWHVVQGGRYQRQAGEHLNPHTYQDIKTIADHTHQDFKGRQGGFAHGGAVVYQGESFPSQYRGGVFMFNIHHRAIYIDSLHRHGSSYVARHAHDLLFANDPWFIGFSLQCGPHGSIYFLDWYDREICHGQTPEGRETGRIYRLAHHTARHAPIDLRTRSDRELAALQTSRNEWMVRHARRLLAERAAQGDDLRPVRSDLGRILKEPHHPIPAKLRALWTLYCIGAAAPDITRPLLSHRNEHLRAWAIQLSLDRKDARLLDTMAQMARSDRSPVVRLYLASALQRLPLAERWVIAENLVRRDEDGLDPLLPLMYWYGIEPLVEADRERALKLAAQSNLALLRQFIARRASTQ